MRKNVEYECPYCPSTSKSAAGRVAHIRGHHKNEFSKFMSIPEDLRKRPGVSTHLHSLMTEPSILETEHKEEGVDVSEFTRGLLLHGITELQRVEKEMEEDLKEYDQLKRDLAKVKTDIVLLKHSLNTVEGRGEVTELHKVTTPGSEHQ